MNWGAHLLTLYEDLRDFGVAGAESTVDFETVGIVQERASQREEDFLWRRKNQPVVMQQFMGVLNACFWSYILVHVSQRQSYTLNLSTRSSFSRSGTSLVPSSRVLRNSTWNSTISGKFPNSTSSWRKKKIDKWDTHGFSGFLQNSVIFLFFVVHQILVHCYC